jgi:anthranilate phosphoribosyltransferase
MSTTTHAPTVHFQPQAEVSSRPTVWKHGVAAGAVAAVVTTVVAAVASSAGVSFADHTGESIPVAAFAQLTIVFSLIGVALAATLARKARRPQSTFVKTTVALTALSVVPDLTFGFDGASAATLVSLHLTAAAIVIPTIARRLTQTR